MKARVSRRQNESCHTCNKKIPSFDLSKVWPLQQNSYHQCMLYDQICTLNICTFYIDTARLNKAFSNFMKRNVASDAWALLKCAIHLSSQCTAWTNIKKPTWLILLHRLSGSLHWNQGSYPNGKVVQQDSLCFSYSMQPLHRSLLAYGLSVPFHIREVSMQAYKITVYEMNCSRIVHRKNLLQDEKKKLKVLARNFQARTMHIITFEQQKHYNFIIQRIFHCALHQNQCGIHWVFFSLVLGWFGYNIKSNAQSLQKSHSAHLLLHYEVSLATGKC